MSSDVPALSVCIPAYGMAGKGADYLCDALESIVAQDYSDLEVVVADQSDDGALSVVCDTFSKRLDLRRIDTRSVARQAAANTNAAMQAARGGIIKILFQDDFLHTPAALGAIVRSFDKPSVGWVLCGTVHTEDCIRFFRPLVPKMNPSLRFGINTVSSPSVLALRADTMPFFDEALVWLMDVDYYHRCADVLGPPEIIETPLVVNRLHPAQATHSVKRPLIRKELHHIAEKEGKDMSFPDRLRYFRYLFATWI